MSLSHICLYQHQWLIIVSLSDVDCGLSVRWEPAENRGDCDEFSPKIIKEMNVVGPVDEALKLRTHQE